MRVTLNGYIVPDDDAWIYEFFGFNVISPAKVRAAIQDNPPGEALTFEVNSGGGSVFAGFEIYSTLLASQLETVAEVQSLAASAASTLILGCNKIMLSPVAQIMMHLPSIGTQGDEVEHQRSTELLKSVKESILNAYETRCKGKCTRAELSNMMAATKWMPAQEAVEIGLADGILYQDDPDPSTIMNAVGCGIRSLVSGDLPDVTQLRAQYQALQRAQPSAAPPPPLQDDWQAKARLAIEKARY